jgi:hypothetical protein
MRLVVAAVLLGGMCVADDSPPIALEDDWRIGKFTVGEPQKIGILTCYRNLGGGYTFLEREEIVFYSLPFVRATYEVEYGAQQSKTLGTIGPSKLPFGGQTIYRTEMKEIGPRLHRRDDTPIAEWSRDTPDGKFQLLILSAEYQTRLKLKSIVPVLEVASKRLVSRR